MTKVPGHPVVMVYSNFTAVKGCCYAQSTKHRCSNTQLYRDSATNDPTELLRAEILIT